MREILFRGKRVDNGEWVYGSLVTTLGWQIINGKRQKAYEIRDLLGNCNLVAPYSVGQYTGLGDGFGYKVFEGDIVKVPIEYNCGCYPHTEIKKKVVEIPGIYRLRVDGEPEIIGNIHDNPELAGDE